MKLPPLTIPKKKDLGGGEDISIEGVYNPKEKSGSIRISGHFKDGWKYIKKLFKRR